MRTRQFWLTISTLALGCSEYKFQSADERVPGTDSGGALGPMIEVQPPIIDYGIVEAGAIFEERVTIRNIGEALLSIDDLFLELNEGLSYDFTAVAPFAWELEPGIVTFVDVTITGPEDAVHLGRLRVDSDDPASPSTYVDLLHELPSEEPPEDTPPEEDPPGDEDPPADVDEPEDTCWEPEDGYEENPAARIFTTDATTPVTVSFVLSDTAYQDELWLDAPVSIPLVSAWIDPVGTTLTLGPYPSESELIFGIQVTNTGMHWQSGPASRNSDGVVHVAVTYEGDCSWLIGFEDLTGGGDLDYNDVVLRVQGMLRQEE